MGKGLRMNQYTSLTLMNLCLIGLVGFGIYYTNSLWCLIGLIFLFSIKNSEEYK